jgi:hypothetical protein
MKEGKTLANIKVKKPTDKKNILPPPSAKVQDYSKQFLGILVKMIIPINSIDKHETVGFIVNNEVRPLAEYLKLSINEISISEKVIKLKKNKKPSIFINSETELLIYDKEFNYDFRIEGWEYHDDSSMESDSGVNVRDSFSKTEIKKGKQKPDFWDKLTPFFGKKVKIVLQW